jgi:predicted acylesterase/phospholipase RssA
MASAAIPIFYEYVDVEGHKFWDGSVLSNTPLRELIHQHRAFWESKIGDPALEATMWDIGGAGGTDDLPNIPGLEVYLVSVWPSKEEIIPTDLDGLKDRKNDITFSDKTEYDETVAVLVTDYIDLVKKVRNIAVKHIEMQERSNFEADMERLLRVEEAQSTRNTGDNRVYEELLKGRVRLTKVVRVERQDDLYGISNKFADFSQDSIDILIADGRRNALEAF